MQTLSDAIAEFTGTAAVALFGFLTFLYLGQFFWAYIHGRRTIAIALPNGSQANFNLFKLISIYDHGVRNIWVFAILVLCLPIFLTSMSNLISLIRPPLNDILATQTIDSAPISRPQGKRFFDATNKSLISLDRLISESQRSWIRNFEELGEYPLVVESQLELVEKLQQSMLEARDRDERANDIIRELRRSANVWANSVETSQLPIRVVDRRDMLGSKYIYFLCIACIGVLITLEFSFLHALRVSAQDWIPMLLSALVVDLITLMILVFVVGNPMEWKAQHPDEFTQISFYIASLFALVSSFLILILARTAGALHDGQIEFPVVEEMQQEVPEEGD